MGGAQHGRNAKRFFHVEFAGKFHAASFGGTAGVLGRSPDQADLVVPLGTTWSLLAFIRRGRRFGASEWGTVPGPVLNGGVCYICSDQIIASEKLISLRITRQVSFVECTDGSRGDVPLSGYLAEALSVLDIRCN